MHKLNKLLQKLRKREFLNAKQAGFTLIELTIYMGILITLFAVLSNIFLSSLEVQSETERSSSVDQDSRFISNRLTYDVASAQSISTPAALGAQTSSLQLVVNGITYTYSVNIAGNLTLSNTSGTYTLNSYDTSVSNFLVKKFGNVGGSEQTIRLSYTLTSRTKIASGTLVKNYTTTLALRKK